MYTQRELGGSAMEYTARLRHQQRRACGVRVRARAMATNDGPRDLFSTAHTQQSAAVMVSPLFAVQRFGAAVCANHNCTDVYKRISTLTTLRHRGFGGDAAQQEEKEGKRGR